MLVDDIKINIHAGKGGKGSVAFNRTKKSLGPVGGSGGRGGSVYFEGVADIGILAKFRQSENLYAENGKDGIRQLKDGRDGESLVLKVPVGTVIHNYELNSTKEIVKIGERILTAKGGNGGKGNYLYRSATNTSPRNFQPGLPGETFHIRLELKLIADCGLIGLPNVGKSSLLNALTNARSKVANYKFTTLEPSLGVYQELILADIPGLIEGASAGKGLGIKFLKHIERTGVLFHILSADSVDPVADYFTIRKELTTYNPELSEKKEYVFLNKVDLVDSEDLKAKLSNLKKNKIEIIPISVEQKTNLEKVESVMRDIIKTKIV